METPSGQFAASPKPEGLRLVSRCPLCEASYNPMEAKVLSEREDGHLLHIRCKKCRNSVLALVTVTAAGVSSVGLVTDLTYDDVVRLQAEPMEVTVDDVLGIHELLEKGESGLVDAILKAT